MRIALNLTRTIHKYYYNILGIPLDHPTIETIEYILTGALKVLKRSSSIMLAKEPQAAYNHLQQCSHILSNILYNIDISPIEAMDRIIKGFKLRNWL